MFYILKRRVHEGWLVCEVYYHGAQVRCFGTKVIAEEVLENIRKFNPDHTFRLIYSEEDM